MKHRILFLATFFVVCRLFSQPTITNFSPAFGPVGSSVTISGSNFSSNTANNIVFFGTVKAVVTAASSTSLTVTAPVGATYEPLSVTTNNLTAYSSKPFNITFPGGGTFTSSSFVTSGSLDGGYPSNIKTADINGDGKLDLLEIVGTDGEEVKVYRNTSSIKNISFTLALTISTTCAYNLTTGDLDGDGKLDLAVTNVCSNIVSLYKNTSTTSLFSFASKIDYGTGAFPYDVIIRDLDMDGKADIAVSNMDGSTVSVLKNTSLFGLLSFNPKVDFSAGNDPRRLTVGDLNEDGRPEIVVANQQSYSVSVFENTSSNGTISFSRISDLPTPGLPESVATSDLDGDGKLDIVVTNSNSTVGSLSIFQNVSSGTNLSFASGFDIRMDDETWPYILSIADMDGDKSPDLVVTTQFSPSVSVLRNSSTSGSISFAGKADYSTGSPYRKMMTVGDFDGDGKSDMAIGNAVDKTVMFLRNVVDGPNIISFTPIAAGTGTTVTITGTNFNGATSVTFGGTEASSFNVVNPTTITAMVAAGSSGEVKVTTSLGIGKLAGFTFTGVAGLVPTITNVAPASGAVGTNVTITGTNFSSTIANNVVYFGAVRATVNAASTTTLAVTVPSGANYEALTVTTNNLTAYAAKPFNITFAGGAPVESSSFAAPTDLATDGNPYNMIVADFDFDGKPDIAVVNASSNSVSIVKNITSNYSISFAPKTNYTTSSGPVDVSSGDFDGDGLTDLAIVNAISNTVSVIRNTSTNGNISFAPKVDFATGSSPRGVKIADLDSDGKPEIVVTNYGGNTFSVFQNTSSGSGVISFAAKVDIPTNSGPIGLSIADIDGDGKADITVANTSSNNVSIFRNVTSNNSIQVAVQVDFATGSSPVDVSIGDLDGDGKVDVTVVNTSSNTVSTFRNASISGSIILGSKVDFPIQSNSTSIFIADINGDSKLDIATSNGNIVGTVSVLQNNSNGQSISFLNEVIFSTGSLPRSIVVADINTDGRPDLLTANYNDNTLSILQNNMAVVLPLKLISFDGRKAVKNTQLNWETQNEENITKFEIQNSVDGIVFSSVGYVLAAGNMNIRKRYGFLHASPKQQINYYRLRIFDRSNQSTYSSIIRVDLSDAINTISIAPNPAVDYVIVSHPALKERSKLIIFDMAGRTVKEVIVNVQAKQTILETKSLSSGSYKVVFTNGKSRTYQTLQINRQ